MQAAIRRDWPKAFAESSLEDGGQGVIEWDRETNVVTPDSTLEQLPAASRTDDRHRDELTDGWH